MAEIKNIYEDSARTKEIYPITHEKAVIDNNGTTAETKFGLLQGLINQKQLEVGAVPIDLTPTRGNTDHIVNSDGIYEFALFDKETVSSDTWITGTVKGAINGSTYAKYTSWDYPKFIPVTGSSMVRVTAGSQGAAVIAFVKNTTMSNGGAVPYATGETGTYTLAVNTSRDFYVPSDANYIHASQKIAESRQFPASVTEMLDAKSATAVLRKEITTVDSTLETKKQDKVYLTDLSNSNIIESRDDINNTNNTYRCTLRMQKCVKGDIITWTATTGLDTGFLIRTFDKGTNQLYQSGWITSYTIQQDGYYTLVIKAINNNTSATKAMLLASIKQSTPIEDIVKQYLINRWGQDIKNLTLNRLCFNNSRNVRQFSGKSPMENQVRYTWLAKLANCQSLAIYKDYVFDFNKGGVFSVYEFGTWRQLGSVNAILPTDEVEFNAAWFSNEFYDSNDEFPILYCEAIYTSPAVLGFRIQNTNGTWSITKVHSIVRDGETGGWVVIYNQQKDQLVYVYNNPKMFFTYPRPKYSESVDGVSTLTDEDRISMIARSGDPVLDFGQDKSVYGNIAVGISYNTQPGNTIFGTDLTTGEMTFTFSPLSNEGEGVEWYNGRLYVCDVKGNLYETIFP